MKRLALLVTALCALTGLPAAAEGDPVEAGLRKALDAVASLQAHGGWGRAYTLDGTVMWGEHLPIDRSWITVQPPATPRTAETFLRAARVLDEPRYEAVARQALAALDRLQTPDGGFPHEGPPDAESRRQATLDDDVTTSALRFFLAWWHHTGAVEDLARVHRVGDFLLKAQYPDSGGWPQAYPPPTSHYARDITFNDNVMRNAIATLLLLHRETGEARYLEGATRGGECIIRLQGGEGEAIWAQQYDPETLEPSWARKFEPPGYTPNESIGACDALIDLYLATGEDRFLVPLPRAFAWYDTHRLENGKWARLYEPGTQRPVYGRRDRAEKVYDFEKATSGYAWQGDWFPHGAKADYERIQNAGREALLADRAAAAAEMPRPEDGRRRAEKLCGALSDGGWWTRPPSSTDLEQYTKYGVAPEVPMVDLGTFNQNAAALLNALDTRP